MRPIRLLAGLVAGAWLVFGPAHDRPSGGKLSLAFTYDRRLTFEPCGCSIAPLGGLEREKNLLARWRRVKRHPELLLTGGTTFVPPAIEFDASELGRYRELGGKLVDELGRMGTAALFLQTEDVLIGVDALRALALRARFPFVSSNLVGDDGAPLFAPKWEVDVRAGVRLLFLALGEEPPAGAPLPPGLRVTPPETALATALEAASGRVVIVVGSFDRARQRELHRRFPQVHVWLGGPARGDEPPLDQLSATSVAATALALGGSILRLDLELTSPLVQLHGPAVAASRARYLEYLRGEVTKLERLPPSPLLEARRSELRAYADVPLLPRKGASRYTVETIPLDATYDGRTR